MEPVYDTDGDEIRDIVKKQAAQIDDIQKTLHGMRNAQRRHFIYRVLWWLVITGLGAWAYYTFVWPYVDQILQLYGGVQGYQDQMAEFFRSFRPGTE